MAWEVQHDTLCEGWVNTWTIEGEDETYVPQTFETKAEAQAEIEQFLHEIARDIEYGERGEDAGYDASEFRVVQIEAEVVAPERGGGGRFETRTAQKDGVIE